MDWVQVTSIVGAVAGLCSFLGIILAYVTKLSKMETKIDLIWKVFVEDALRSQVKIGTLQHSSPYSLAPKSGRFMDLVSANTVSYLKSKNISDTHSLVEEYIRYVGFTTVLEESSKRDLTTQEYLALCVGVINSKTTNRISGHIKLGNSNVS